MDFLLHPLLFLLLGGIVGWLFSFFEIKNLHRRLFEEKKTSTEKIAFYQKMLEKLDEQFKGVSSTALKHNNEAFLQLAASTFETFHERAKGELEKKNQALVDVLKPMKDSLEKFDGRVQELEKARLGAYVSLKQQVDSLIEGQKSLRQETSNLVKALRAPHVRGRWGEIQLRRVVELAGMLNHCDFFEQESVSGEEQTFRPDLIVKLPGERNIVVDAKVPLSAYLEALDTSDEERRRQCMKDHARHVRNHMTLLGRKSYWDQFQPSPEFVVLFLPAETFFSAALEYDPSLIEGGVQERVILATPTTLIALLKSIAYGWRQEALSQNAEEISALGRDLYKRLGDMGSHFTKMGKSLEGAVEAYNKGIASLESRVMVSARRFKELESTGTQKEIDILEPMAKMTRVLEE